MATFTNRLAKESSPYLLQHAHNPVDWYPWSNEALQRAKDENKPMLVSIGYSACHWCHVMEKESFEDEATAKTMNEFFVNIKIDREERPDLDHIYMDAVQAMTGSGGWPLNVFLTPDGKPFYGGTYFPPRPVQNRPSWNEVLNAVAIAFRERRNEIDSQAENLTEHIRQSNSFGLQPNTNLTKDVGAEMFSNIMKQADKDEGGFGHAPKFPQTFIIRYLLNYYYHTKDKEALAQACLSLDKMIRGGIYDQAGGGFARYSTDNGWLVPHFEKMLYDNALLIIALSDAHKITGNALYKRCIEQTMDFVERELLSPETGFWSALDADSEGVEGKFYVWTKDEIDAVLGNDSELFCELFDVTASGNWEHVNILNMPRPLEELASQKQISADNLWQLASNCLAKLLKERSKRVRPLLDDKILLGWNALMNTACCKAYAVTGQVKYKELSVRNMEFIWKNFREKDGRFYHSWKNQIAKYPAFLDDYTYLVEALIHLQEITGDAEYLHKAKLLAELVIEQFSEDETGFFFFTARDQGDVIVRKKEVYDGAVPAGNSVMAANLYYLGIVFANEGWKERGVRMCTVMLPVVQKYPTSFGIWATMTLALSYNNIPEIAIVGENFESVLKDILRTFIPFCIIQSAPHDNKDFPLLTEKPQTQGAHIYLCRHYACQTPVTETNELVRLLEIV